MTHISSSLNATHGEFGASKSVRCAPTEGAPYSPRRVGRPLHTIPQAFERMNAPQMRRDRFAGALPPVWLMVIAAGTCLFTLLVADAMYREFFEWMVGL